MKRPHTNGAGGFTLLEVLIAFAILAVLLVPILKVFGDGLGSTETARTYATAALLARSKLAALGIDEPLKEGETSGTFEAQGQQGYRWRLAIVRDISEVGTPEGSSGADEAPSRRRARARQSSGSDSGFGSGTSLFGKGTSGFGDTQSSFGKGTSGFGTTGRSGASATSGTRSRSGQQGDADGGGEGVEAGPMAMAVTLTVEWGGVRDSRAVTLTTLRLARSQGTVEDFEQ
jgi:type II secretion system protein I